jgi:hypothetical protein
MILEVLCGMICSGKSSWAKQRAKEGWLVMNDDGIVNMLHGGDYTLYDKDLKPLYKSVEDHVLHSVVLLGRNLVIDRGLDISVKARRRWIVLAGALDVPVRAVCFERFSPEVHGTRRFQSDSRGHTEAYWIEVARAHDRRYQEPTTDEGFSEIIQKKWEE